MPSSVIVLQDCAASAARRKSSHDRNNSGMPGKDSDSVVERRSASAAMKGSPAPGVSRKREYHKEVATRTVVTVRLSAEKTKVWIRSLWKEGSSIRRATPT